jgi:pimeloyl-ACP methyl ester carboxylesterase
LYYDEHGVGQPVLLLSGLGGNRLGWRKQVAPLSAKFRVIAMDNRDAGDSGDSVIMYTIANMAADSAALIEALALGPTHVAGWSMGGFIAQELAIRFPQAVAKLVLVATTAGGPAAVPAAPEILATLVRSDDDDIESRVRRSYVLSTGPSYAPAHPEDVDKAVELAIQMPMPQRNYLRQVNAVRQHNTGDRLSRIAAPTLVIHGDCDALVPYANGQYLAEHIPGARLSTYEGVGHLPPIEAPERFNQEVSEFLSV